MHLILKTANPDHFFEINQYTVLEGVLLDVEKAAEQKMDINLLIQSFLEQFSTAQKIYVPVIASGFRNQLDEIRKLIKISPQIVPMVLLLPDGLMSLKASNTLKLECALYGLNESGQLLLIPPFSGKIMIDFASRRYFMPNYENLIKGIQSMPREMVDRMMAVLPADQNILCQIFQSGITTFILDYDDFNALLYHTANKQLQQDHMETWVLTYIRETLTE